VLVPPSPVCCAPLGLLVATSHRAESHRAALDRPDTEAELAAIFADLESRAVEWARGGALPVDQIVLTRSDRDAVRPQNTTGGAVGRQATAAVRPPL